jgi:hypothetical protein
VWSRQAARGNAICALRVRKNWLETVPIDFGDALDIAHENFLSIIFEWRRTADKSFAFLWQSKLNARF